MVNTIHVDAACNSEFNVYGFGGIFGSLAEGLMASLSDFRGLFTSVLGAEAGTVLEGLRLGAD